MPDGKNARAPVGGRGTAEQRNTHPDDSTSTGLAVRLGPLPERAVFTSWPKATVATGGKASSVKWPALAARFEELGSRVQPKSECSLVGFLTVADGRRRGDAVRTVTALGLDYDDGAAPLAAGLALLEGAGLAGLCYESPSASPTAPKWRIIIPLAEPWTDSTTWSEAYERLVAWAQAETGLLFDLSMKDATRSFYPPTRRTDADPNRAVVWVPGEALDLRATVGRLVAPSSTTTTTSVAPSGETAEALAGALAPTWPSEGAGYHQAVLALAGVLLREGYSDGEAVGLLEAAAPPRPTPRPYEIREAVSTTRKRLEQGATASGWGKLVEMFGQPAADAVADALGRPRLASSADGSRTDDDEDDDGRQKRQTQSEALLKLATSHGLALFRCEGEGYADIRVNRVRSTVRARSLGPWLRRLFFEAEGKAPSAQALTDALGVLEARAMYDAESPERAVHVRLAPGPDRVALDLGDATGRAALVDRDGWRLTSEPDARFLRPQGMRPIPAPVDCEPSELPPLLSEVLNARDEDLVALTGWLVGTLAPRGPYPVLVLLGEQGSAKSWTARVLRDIVDPQKAGLRATPREPRDLAIAAERAWVVSYDNISGLPSWLSDSLCSLATGSGFATRQLYTDADERLFEAARPVVLNGIAAVANRADLLDRAIVVTLPPLDPADRRPEAELVARLDELRPRILGALLAAASRGLRDLASTRPPCLTRMADHETWVAATEPAWCRERGAYGRTLRSRREQGEEELASTEPIVAALAGLIAGGPFTGTVSELLARLNREATPETVRSRVWPPTPAALGSKLVRLASVLRRHGIDVAKGAGRHRSRLTVRAGGSKQREGGICSHTPHALHTAPQPPGNTNEQACEQMCEQTCERASKRASKNAATTGNDTVCERASKSRPFSASTDRPAARSPTVCDTAVAEVSPPPERPLPPGYVRRVIRLPKVTS